MCRHFVLQLLHHRHHRMMLPLLYLHHHHILVLSDLGKLNLDIHLYLRQLQYKVLLIMIRRHRLIRH